MESVRRQTGIKPKELENLIALPESMSQVWKFFLDLHNSRTHTAFGPNPITFSDMKAYFDLFDIIPQDFEIQAIQRLDMELIKNSVSEVKNAKK